MTTRENSNVTCSVIIPVGRRVDDLPVLLGEYDEALKSSGGDYEIIVVLDGRKDDLSASLKKMYQTNHRIVLIELAREFGESAALSAGFDAARGEILMTLPAYYQVEPVEITKLIAADRKDVDMLVAVRPRSGMSFDKMRRRAFHAVFRLTSGMFFRDLGCGVRLMHSIVAQDIVLYGDQHRFFPALARRRGFRVDEIELVQSPKDRFRGRYRMREYLHRFLDVLTVFFLVRFTKKPLRFFGTIGFLAASIGGLFVLVLLIQRFFLGVSLADRPALLLASLLIVLGVQTFALGLIGELIIFTHASQMKEYNIRRIIQSSADHERSDSANDSGSEPKSGGRFRRQI